MTKHLNLLQLKITLCGTKPPIWREIIVPADYSFFDLHVAIQDAMGWQDCHLHQFFTQSPYLRNSQYKRISWPSPEDDFGEVSDERQVKLCEYLDEPGDIMYYEYDLGDSWMHEIKLVQALSADSNGKYPQILSGERACPPEDCGGLGGYYGLIETLKDPGSEDYESIMSWLDIEGPKEFIPEKFDIKEIKFNNPKKILKQYQENMPF